MLLKTPQCTGCPSYPHKQELPAPRVNSAEDEKPWTRESRTQLWVEGGGPSSPGFESCHCHLCLHNPRQFTSPLWASVSPSKMG